MTKVLGRWAVALALAGPLTGVSVVADAGHNRVALAVEAAAALQERPVTITFRNTPIEEVLIFFAEVSGRSIVSGPGVTGMVNTSVVNQPWDEALRSILRTHGFIAEETREGIVEVHVVEDLPAREAGEPLQTATYRVNYATAAEVLPAIQTLLTERGTATVAPGTNQIVVSDIARVQLAVTSLIRQLDVQTAQITINAKLIFVSRTDLNEFGVTYDLKDSAGNQLNLLTPGGIFRDGEFEEVEVGTNVVALGGNSVAALGNATSRVVGPTLTLMSSLLIGRHTLINFIEALESSSLSEVQAEPYVRVMDNRTARIRVGEDTPIRVIDASAGAGPAGSALPVASVEIVETGIILIVTPSVTADDMIRLDVAAERSAPQLAAGDAGVTFTTQVAETQVLVRDGETAVIGGLTVTEQTEVRSGIPLLMDLPLVGRLFRVTRKSHGQRDLIILVTPHLVRAPLD